LAPPSGVTSGAGGHTVAASSENFPAVVGNGVSMSMFGKVIKLICSANYYFLSTQPLDFWARAE